MSSNLTEFLKVLTIVVSWSTLILVGRHYMLSIDEPQEDEDADDAALILNEQSQINEASKS